MAEPQTSSPVAAPATALAPPIQPFAPSPVQQTTAMQEIGVWIAIFFLFIAYGRAFDFIGKGLHMALVVSCLALLFTFLTGGLKRALYSVPGLLLTAFTCWLVLATPFSVWKGGSVITLKDIWSKSYLVFILVAGLLSTIDHCRRAIDALAYSTLLVSILSLYYGSSIGSDRLQLPTGALDNPNELAQLLLVGLPCWLFKAMTKSRIPLRRPLAVMCIIMILLVTLRTGSRGGLLAFIGLIIVIFWYASWLNKLKLLGATVILAVIAFGVLPQGLRGRYATLFDQEVHTEVGAVEVTAVASLNSRIHLLKQSLRITLRHPLLGVGPGMFVVEAAEDDHSQGRRALYQGTHNTFTQVSSEAGIPGFLLYVGVFYYCMKHTSAIYRLTRRQPQFQEISSMAFCLLLSLASLVVNSFFNYVAYGFCLPTLAGICTPFIRSARLALSQAQPAQLASLAGSPVASRDVWPSSSSFRWTS